MSFLKDDEHFLAGDLRWYRPAHGLFYYSVSDRYQGLER